MTAISSDESWSTPLQHRVQFYQSQIHGRSANTDLVSNSALLSDITKTFNTLNAFAAELKMCINAMSITACLSPEILALVFRFLSRNLPVVPHYTSACEGLKGHGKGTGVLSTWVKVTHVSKRWRAVALSDTSLWNVISTTHGTSWAQAFLERSGIQTIHLHLGECISDEIDDPIWRKIVPRAHTIQIRSNVSEWEDQLQDLDAQSLRALHVCLDYEGLDEVCPQHFFNSISDGFRELELYGYYTYSLPSLSTYSNITSLRLGALSEDHWVEVDPIGSVLKVLSQLRHLQKLTFLGLDAQPDLSEEFITIQYSNSVHLPQLQLLHLENCRANTLLTLFDAIVPPAGVVIRIITNFLDWDGYRECIAEFKTVLERRLSSTPWNSFQAVAIFPTLHTSKFLRLTSPNDNDCFAVSAWRSDPDIHVFFSVEDPDSAQKLEPELYISLPKVEEYDDYPLKIFCLFAKPSVHTLFLMSDRVLGTSFIDWSILRFGFSALRHILLDANICATVTASMYEDCLGNILGTRSSTRHPKLTRLAVFDGLVDWTQEVEVRYKFGGNTGRVTPPLAQLLQEVYRIRTDKGYPMEISVSDPGSLKDALGSAFNMPTLKELASNGSS